MPRKLPSRKIALLKIAPWMIFSPPPTTAPSDNWPPDNCPLDNCPRIIASGQLSQRYCPLTISPWKLPAKKIAFRMICRLHNCPPDKWPGGKLPPRKVIPRINYTRDFFPRIRNRSTLIDSCFLLFPSFVV